jgi:hypothetical protein
MTHLPLDRRRIQLLPTQAVPQQLQLYPILPLPTQSIRQRHAVLVLVASKSASSHSPMTHFASYNVWLVRRIDIYQYHDHIPEAKQYASLRHLHRVRFDRQGQDPFTTIVYTEALHRAVIGSLQLTDFNDGCSASTSLGLARQSKW